MPGIDYAAVKARLSWSVVLDAAGWTPTRNTWYRLRGPCPLRCSTSDACCAVDLRRARYYCGKCKRGGNRLDFFAAAKGVSLFRAAVELCAALGVDVPYLASPRPKTDQGRGPRKEAAG